MITRKRSILAVLTLGLLALYPAPFTFAENGILVISDDKTSEKDLNAVQADYNGLVSTLGASEEGATTASSLERPPNDATNRPNDATSRPNDATSRPNDATLRPNNATNRPNNATNRPNDATRRPNTTASDR